MLTYFKARLHYNAAALKQKASGGFQWVHVLPKIEVPPVGYGSYNFLVMEISEKRACSDLVISAYNLESFEQAKKCPVPILQIQIIESPLLKFVYAYFLGPFFRTRSFGDFNLFLYQSVANAVAALPIRNVLLWNTLGACGIFRQRLPEAKICFAQRHYQYDSNDYHQYNYCDHVIMQTRGQVRQAFSRASVLGPFISVIPNGVDTARFRPVDPETRVGLRKKHGISADSLVVFMPSKLSINKASHYIPRWVRHFENTHPEIFFILAGYGWQIERFSKHHLNELKAVLGHAKSAKWLEGINPMEMHEYYQLSDICLMSNTWKEGFSMASLEAMASGLTVVAPDSGSYPEIIRNGFNGILFPQENMYRSVIEAIEKLASRPENILEIGRNARNHIVARLNRSIAIGKFTRFLDERAEEIEEKSSILPPDSISGHTLN